MLFVFTGNMDDILKNIEKFVFYIEGKVQFSDVDSFDVVHNIKYLYWIENSRLEYFENIGIQMDKYTLKEKFPLMVVNTSISYFEPLFFRDKYKVYCRVSSVGNSSITMENIITNKENKICAFAKSVLVHLEKGSFKSKRIPDDIRDKIRHFEKSNVIFLE